MVHQTSPPLPLSLSFLHKDMSPVEHVLAARPRVQRRKKIKRRWRRCTVSITLFFAGTDTEQKTSFPSTSSICSRQGKGKRNGTEVESPRLSTNYSTRVVGIVDIEGHSTD